MDAARREGITPKHAHETITAQQAVHLVSEHVGMPSSLNLWPLAFASEGVVVKPLSDASLCFQTYVIMRTDDDSDWQTSSSGPSSASIRISAAAQANGIVPVRLSCQLENSNSAGGVFTFEFPRGNSCEVAEIR